MSSSSSGGYGRPEAAAWPQPSATQWTIAHQQAAAINNVGRDQHNAYVLQQRESFLREVAAAKSKARVLSWIGGLMTVVGMGTWAYVIFSFAERIPEFGIDTSPAELFGPEVFGGVRLGMLAMGTMLLGMVLLIVGIVLHISSAARRRRLDRDLTLHPGGYYTTFPGR